MPATGKPSSSKRCWYSASKRWCQSSWAAHLCGCFTGQGMGYPLAAGVPAEVQFDILAEAIRLLLGVVFISVPLDPGMNPVDEGTRKRERRLHCVHSASKAYEDGTVFIVSIVRRMAVNKWLTACWSLCQTGDRMDRHHQTDRHIGTCSIQAEGNQRGSGAHHRQPAHCRARIGEGAGGIVA